MTLLLNIKSIARFYTYTLIIVQACRCDCVKQFSKFKKMFDCPKLTTSKSFSYFIHDILCIIDISTVLGFSLIYIFWTHAVFCLNRVGPFQFLIISAKLSANAIANR